MSEERVRRGCSKERVSSGVMVRRWMIRRMRRIISNKRRRRTIPRNRRIIENH